MAKQTEQVKRTDITKYDAECWIRDFYEVGSLMDDLYNHLEQLNEDYKHLSVGAKKWLYGMEFTAMGKSTYLKRTKEYVEQLNEPWTELEYLTERLFEHDEEL